MTRAEVEALLAQSVTETEVAPIMRVLDSWHLEVLQAMSAGLAHEVRNPLNAAKLQLELLERRLRRATDDERLIEPSQLARHEIERLTSLLNEFLAFACPPDLNVGEHDVAGIVREVVDEERSRCGADLELVTCPNPLVAQVDAPKLQQVVHNLVRNAIEAVAPDGHVRVEIGGDDERIALAVQDDGPGIPDELRPRIYEPFFSTKQGGPGLGMSIVHSFVALHGGSIALASSDRGTRIDVTIPRR